MIYAKFKTDQAKAEEIKDFYSAQEIKEERKPYEYFLTRSHGVTIHAYKNKQSIYTIVFSGSETQVRDEISQFSHDYTVTKIDDNAEKKDTNYIKCWEDLGRQIGSDEVGVGDFFGPLIVTASYVTEKDIAFLEKYKVNDSKKMNDDYILDIGPILKRRIANYTVMVSPDKLSRLQARGFNIHKAMAKCHNLAQKALMEKYEISADTIIYVDQFTPENDYRKLVAEEIVTNPLVFRTRGESYYPSVAVSSVISRYAFLKEWKHMEEIFHITIPKGASALVDKVYGRLKNTYGQDEIDPYVKRFFSNYEK